MTDKTEHEKIRASLESIVAKLPEQDIKEFRIIMSKLYSNLAFAATLEMGNVFCYALNQHTHGANALDNRLNLTEVYDGMSKQYARYDKEAHD